MQYRDCIMVQASNRVGLNGVTSMEGFLPATISAITFPITGPADMPKCEFPKAMDDALIGDCRIG
jgi:hypothetical protein